MWRQKGEPVKVFVGSSQHAQIIPVRAGVELAVLQGKILAKTCSPHFTGQQKSRTLPRSALEDMYP